ncbi:MAG TPA: hypothetical protein VGR10_00510 [Thermoleophilaceae bacterium]|nr:hypothetical protein [Thermoleophilaceae bacterium]
MSALEEVVAAADPALAAHAVREPGRGELEGEVGGGPRAFVVEAIREGYLLHYGEPRAFAGMDDDLRLLAGDALFALGLERLAREGDLGAVTELSDLISLSARAEAEGRAAAAGELWRASVDRLSPRGGPGARAAFERGLRRTPE